MDLLKPGDAAKFLRVTAFTLRKWSQQGELPFQITPGGHRRYVKSDLYAFAKIKGLQVSDPLSSDHPSSLPVKAMQSLSLLIVDSNRSRATSFKHMLESHDTSWQVDVVYDGFEAGLQVHEHKPDVLVTALALPGMSGADLITSIKAVATLKHIHLIGMCDHNNDQDKDAFLSAGAEAYVPLPCSQETLIALLESRLNPVFAKR